MFGYGEDALTFWALTKELPQVLSKLEEDISPAETLVFYRPSFGRRGGPIRAEFGEFDFILAAKARVYLGESKWDKSGGIKANLILRSEQQLRHKIFRWYLTNWLKYKPNNWGDFCQSTHGDPSFPGGKIAPEGSLLAQTLETILGMMDDHFRGHPVQVHDVLLYFHTNSFVPTVQQGFTLIDMDYSPALVGSLITLF